MPGGLVEVRLCLLHYTLSIDEECAAIRRETALGRTVDERQQELYKQIADRGGRVVKVDRVVWKIIPDASTAATALQQGEVDLVEQPSLDLVPVLAKNRDVVVRFAMAYLQAAKEFNAAAAAPDKYPEIIDILAKNTALNKPELVKAIAPNWSYMAEDGLPLIDSIMQMQDFWSGKYYQLVEKKVTKEQLFDLSIAREAKARLDKEKPFGN